MGSLADTMAQVRDDHAPIAISRKSKGAEVMVSMEGYRALKGSAYLLGSPGG